MLFLYTSNQLEQLSGFLSKVTSTPLDNPLTKETVIVQNAGMARWLSMQLADISGISANIEYLFPAEFMWKLLRIVSSGISEQSQCTPETLQFHIMEELSLNDQNYPELHHYIRNNDEQKNAISIWQLSVELSQIFDQYLFYRSDWIQEWEDKPQNSIRDDWQERLWIHCVKDKNLVHWLSLQNQFKDAITLSNQSELPERVSFFSMPALSPGYLDLLGELSQKTDVYLYIINPSEDVYWGNILSKKDKAKLSLEQQEETDIGNPLLASMGKQGRDFIHQLLELGEHEHISSTNASNNAENSNNILFQLQEDVYQLEHPEIITNYDHQLDTSITFNSCHTPMREVEVLYDQILDALDSDESLSPADIIVMPPDIEVYAPYIETIFSNSQTKLPFSIADRNPLNALQLVEVLLKAFSLIGTRFDVESVFEILESAEVRENFNLDESQLEKCRTLARATNIRWGINKQYRKNNNLPDTPEHTWKYALDSLLLGYTLGANHEDNPLFEMGNMHPLFSYNEIEGNDVQILSSLKQFTDILFTLDRWSSAEQSLEIWLDKLKEFISQLFSESSDVSLILNSINKVKQVSELTEFEQDISFEVFFKILQENLASISGTEKFLGHGITFCAMVPMRSVPFKLVVLMGMNDGQFPRLNKHHSFDRLGENPKRGDRSKRNEDRYLFLESILASRSRLIISYIGQSVKDNTELPPSILVSELLDTLEAYSKISVEEWVIKHPLQAFSSRYFDQSSGLFSYENEYTQIHKMAESSSQIFIEEALPELDKTYKKLSLSDLIDFYKSPARSFLKHHFSIQTFNEDIILPVREPFELESFKSSEIRNIITESIEDDQLKIIRARGLLPYGEIGDGVFHNETEIVSIFQAGLPKIHYKDNQSFKVTIDNFELLGEIDHLTETGRVLKQLTQAYFPDYINIWLNHLILNIVSPSGVPRYTTFYSPEDSFTLTPIEGAEEQLKSLLNYYWQGLHFPLNFFPKAAKACYEKSPENIKLAINMWEGSNQNSGERDKFENWLLYRTMKFDTENIPKDFLQTSYLLFGNFFSVKNSL